VQQRFYIETLGCPKNDVDSDKIMGTLLADGLVATDDPSLADVVVVNTCAFIEDARKESIDTVLALESQRKDGARIVVTGCMAERYGQELADALPEVDQPKSTAPWAYVKIAEGCDRNCGFCAIPSFRGPQRSRDIDQILREVDELEVQEIVLIAQDLASYGKDRPSELGAGSIVPLVQAVAKRVARTRLLYLYPSDLTDELIHAMLETNVPYFDLSLQHVSKPHLRRMRRWGDGDRFLKRIEDIRALSPQAAFRSNFIVGYPVEDIRALSPQAAFRSNFIVGYPGETEEDHDQLLRFVEEAQLDWCGFFTFSPEEGTHAMTQPDHVDQSLMNERIAELREMQDNITASRRDDLIGETVNVLVDERGIGRTHREAPSIDGVVHVSDDLEVGKFYDVTIADAMGPDLLAAGANTDAFDGEE